MSAEDSGGLGGDRKDALARAFILDANSEWVTVATGVAVTEVGEETPTLTVSLHDEADESVLFSTTFHKDQDIARQQVVTWTSGDGADVALSFENELGCDHFWSEICQFLGRPAEYAPHEAEEEAEHHDDGAPMSEEERSGAIILPDEVEFSTVPDIEELLERAVQTTPDIRRSVCIAIIARQYVGRLLELFRIAEDLDSRETLFRLYAIFKHLVLLNNPAILRELLSEQHVFHVAGVFEWDPAYPETRPGYRQYLLDRQRFRQVVDLENGPLVSLIHHTFRTQYLKDVVLPRILDEETFGSLLFMVRCNYAEIIEILEGETDFMIKLLPLFQSQEVAECEAVLKFMKEFLAIAKSSANGRNLKLYQEMAFSELLRFLQRMLSMESAINCRVLATDVLIAVTQHDPNIIRSFMVEAKGRDNSRDGQGQLLNTIIDRIIDSQIDVGLRWQLVAVLRTLLDSAGPLGLSLPNDEFLNFFYPDYALRLLAPLIELDKSKKIPSQGPIVLTPGEADLHFNCCELLCSFIIQHKYRIKYLLFRSFIVQNAILLLRCRDKYLRLCAIRVVRTMVGTGDDFYFRFFMKQSLLKPLIDEAIRLGGADNAISSALVEFFYHIRDKKYKMLIGHLVEGYKVDLERIKSAPVYDELLKVCEELNDPLSETPIEKETPRQRDTWLGVDRNEDAYFSTADEEDEAVEVEMKVENEDPTSPMAIEEPTAAAVAAVAMAAATAVDEVDIPHRMAATWRDDDDDRNKRMKY